MMKWKAMFVTAAIGLAYGTPVLAQTAASQAASFNVASFRGSPSSGAYQSDFARMRQDDLERGGRGKGKDNGKGHEHHGNGHGYGHDHGHCDGGEGCHASPG